MFESFGLMQVVNFSTHEIGNTLDLIIVKDNVGVNCLETHSGELLSDHMYVHAKFSLPAVEFERKKRSFRRLDSINKNNFQTDLHMDVLYFYYVLVIVYVTWSALENIHCIGRNTNLINLI